MLAPSSQFGGKRKREREGGREREREREREGTLLILLLFFYFGTLVVSKDPYRIVVPRFCDNYISSVKVLQQQM